MPNESAKSKRGRKKKILTEPIEASGGRTRRSSGSDEQVEMNITSVSPSLRRTRAMSEENMTPPEIEFNPEESKRVLNTFTNQIKMSHFVISTLS